MARMNHLANSDDIRGADTWGLAQFSTGESHVERGFLATTSSRTRPSGGLTDITNTALWTDHSPASFCMVMRVIVGLV